MLLVITLFLNFIVSTNILKVGIFPNFFYKNTNAVTSFVTLHLKNNTWNWKSKPWLHNILVPWIEPLARHNNEHTVSVTNVPVH